ncbi:bifunctional 3-(3-hydroxy-phenyl)propionate/3-hydroxycinnamic acid hydroxylase [Lysobacter capsici]|uniref:bifunctional 3-(3-hydroxy-phenyl)propionate/3-hydroxycinnamic acid hydroxylase n=1 Tax=Lysobacter capsici TaxID=435897 RepID=UPI001C005225|nr:bifunctional 3-(3-hydroxy-phenyl)propionate/3-hydroxycinnamic acid hydroxylase [Lysobacter capsici]QWF17947.1 bifunctional 3-(3-hydroxy-phenyl)propionate/3-hydroxycinnamic acid hydroxylase [Lysobacter capsici]
MHDTIATIDEASRVPHEIDVLVVGYGPVGAAVAALLGRHGVRTLVIDKAPDILLAPRAISLDNEALRVLQMAGLDDDAFDKVAIPFVRMHSPLLGQFACINTSGSIDGQPKLVTFYQPDLERALRDQVGMQACVTALTSTEMLDFVDGADGVTATLGLANGSHTTVRARYLVGADGASSQVRNAIGQGYSGRTYAEDWLIVDAQNVPGAFDHIEFLCDFRRPTPHMTAPGGRTRWEFMLQPGETREQMERDDTIARLLAPWSQGRQELTIERKAVYRFHARCCERFSRGRVFLVGDAAHITPPFVGQGLVAGLRDAANLAWKLAWVVQDKAAPAILDSYDRERRPHAKKMIGLAKLMGQMVMPRGRTRATLVHGLMWLVNHTPGLRDFLQELGVKPENRFADGLFVKGRAASRLRRGGQLPQGLVRAASGEVMLSDQILGDGLVLIGFGLPVEERLGAALAERWRQHGGRFVQFCQRGGMVHRSPDVFEDLDNRLVPDAAPHGWCAVVRPDRTVVHDGPIEQAERIASESLALIAGGSPQRSAHLNATPQQASG